MKRSEVKETHENSVLAGFKSLSELNGNIVEILDKPEPPDAIITINGKKTWIEITDAFISPEHARSITSQVAEDKEWIKSTPGLINVDDFNETLKGVIKAKYDKDSIQRVYRKRGAGILIVGCFSPFHYPIEENIEELISTIQDTYSSNEPMFNEIYLYDYDYKLVKVV
ncbi:hypothetical protein H4J45_09730 [Colwellia sp. BRX10-6]|uniref:hypothetical protein n=1 Tax=unclassified Colwellia TaxID=196834 RepID=UPI0015F38F1A|nr:MULTISPECIES: hypothetical protein [unclassified Colwellia]MBA6383653.1 hypothetical protein [Colwellia sp. BRX10-9]MBA6394363.1 hypothetical protein [Colwellia sp. BRX10-6]